MQATWLRLCLVVEFCNCNLFIIIILFVYYYIIIHCNLYIFSMIKSGIEYYNIFQLHCLCTVLQPQIRKSWDSMENANKKRK